MAFCDFVVNYDPAKDTQLDVSKRILYSIIVKRLKNNKPAVIFIGGGSGEGKSWGAIRAQELLMQIQGRDINPFFDTMNIYTPIQYPEKLDKLLFDKDFKYANIICLHEAREVVKAKLWNSFLVQSVADINTLSRAVKRMCVMIVSQFIRDISTDIRYTLNYYMIVRRPLSKRPRLYINVMWKDDRDLEKPKLRKRKLAGYLVMPNGKYRRFVPQYLELAKPDKYLIQKFMKGDFEAKSNIIKGKINALLAEMKTDMGQTFKKVDAMVDWYGKDLDRLSVIGKRYRGKWKVKPEIKDMHDLTVGEVRQFEEKLNDVLKNKGVLEYAEE